MKQCTKCGETKPLDKFSADKSKQDGLHTQCKSCRSAADRLNYAKKAEQIKQRVKEYRLADPERKRRMDAESYARNKDKRTAYHKERYARHSERIKAKTAAYFQANKEKLRPYFAQAQCKRRATKRNATPVWADHNVILFFFVTRQYLTQETGFEWHVDHVVPLQGRYVCGLHVHNNLRVVPATDNLRKSNSFSN